MSDLEDKRTELDAIALSVQGIVGSAIGLSTDGVPVIKIYIDRPLAQINLPKELIDGDFEFEYIGHISPK